MITKKMLLILHVGLFFHINMIQSATTYAKKAFADFISTCIRRPNSEVIRLAHKFDSRGVEFNQKVKEYFNNPKEVEQYFDGKKTVKQYLQDATTKAYQLQKTLLKEGKYGNSLESKISGRQIAPWNDKDKSNLHKAFLQIKEMKEHFKNVKDQLELHPRLIFFKRSFKQYPQSEFSYDPSQHNSIQKIAKFTLPESEYPVRDCAKELELTLDLWIKQQESMPTEDPDYISWLQTLLNKIKDSDQLHYEEKLFKQELQILGIAEESKTNRQCLNLSWVLIPIITTAGLITEKHY